MNGRKLLEALSFIDETWIEEAERETLSGPAIPVWLQGVAVAACLCILLSGVYVLGRDWYGSVRPAEGVPAVPDAPGVQAPEEPEAMGAPLAPPEEDMVPAEGSDGVTVTRVRILSWENFTVTGIVEDPGSDELTVGQEITVLLEPEEEFKTRGNTEGILEVHWRSLDEETMTIRALKVVVEEESE